MPFQMKPYQQDSELKRIEPRKTSLYKVMACGYKTPCWIWQGTLLHGYGRIEVRGIGFPAHVIIYRQYFKGFNYKLELDHLCEIRSCVNPEHLEPVTHQENLDRSSKLKQYREKKEIERKSFEMRLKTDVKLGLSHEELKSKYGLYSAKLNRILKRIK